MVDEAIHFENPVPQIFPIPQNAFFKFFHNRLLTTGQTPRIVQRVKRIDNPPCIGDVLESLPVTEEPVLVLASNSPRRHELFALAGWMFRVKVADVDESPRAGEAPTDYVLRLAETKARAIKTYADQIILAADTAVVDGKDILGKPKDIAEAVAMLARLRGHTHQVYTGIALLRQSDGRLLKDLCITNVSMRGYSEDEIFAYVGTGDPLDKAGAYAIQHAGFRPVSGLSGCYASVMGLPVCHVVRLMQQFEISPAADVPINCQTLLEYQCPVFRAILRGEL